MFCENCGSNVPDGTKFCPKCGNKLKIPIKKQTPSASNIDSLKNTWSNWSTGKKLFL